MPRRLHAPTKSSKKSTRWALLEWSLLVLHGLAGVLASELAARFGDRIESTVLVAAVVPAPGERFVDVMGFPNSLLLEVLFKFNPQGLKPSERMLRAELGSDLSDADAVALVDQYEAE